MKSLALHLSFCCCSLIYSSSAQILTHLPPGDTDRRSAVLPTPIPSWVILRSARTRNPTTGLSKAVKALFQSLCPSESTLSQLSPNNPVGAVLSGPVYSCPGLGAPVCRLSPEPPAGGSCSLQPQCGSLQTNSAISPGHYAHQG